MNNIAHKWQPLKGLDAQPSGVDFQEIDSLRQQWLTFRKIQEESDPDAYKAFLERLYRSWAIETGIIEGIYNIDSGTTETLVEKGLSADLIEPRGTDRDPHDLLKVLKDHQDTATFVTDSIKTGTELSGFYICQLHQILLRNQKFYVAYDQFGTRFETELDHGGFKKHPNNPTRSDGQLHEYCPHLQVDSEIANLVDYYREFQHQRSHFHPLRVAAWLHHRFTQIHPFQDGNGRVARALLTWHLAKENYLPVVISRDDRAEYIDTLEQADSGDIKPFIKLIVKLESHIILEALGEPVPVAASSVVSQVLDHITERVRKSRKNELDQRRLVNSVAESLQNTAKETLELRANQIAEQLEEAGLGIWPKVNIGGPGDNEHWYRFQILRSAKEARHWVNFNEDRFFVRLAINPKDQSRTPRLIFVISLHHVGRQLTGVMAATAFAQIVNSRFGESEDAEETNGSDYVNCTPESFAFTSDEDVTTIKERFTEWVEGPLSVGLRHWSEFIS